MQKIELLKLNLKNFKGIEDFSLVVNGKNAEIRGRNGAGKTTIFDAFTWLLFGKDSKNRTDFEIKTLDKDGNVKQHGIEHSVEAVLSVNGEVLTLKRVFKEVWKKKKGTANKVFTGHTTDFYIDEMPVKKKEFEEKVNSLISDDIFQLLTNPLHFNEVLNKNQRRAILFEIVGEITDAEIAAQSGNEELIELVNRLNGKDIEKHKAYLKKKQQEVNKKIDETTIRIDEITLRKPNTDGLDEQKLLKQIQEITSSIDEKMKEITQIRNGGKVSEYRKRLSEIELEIAEIRNEYDKQTNEEINRLKVKVQELESNITLLESKRKSEKEALELYRKRAEDLSVKLNELRNEWDRVDEEKLEFEDNDTCPTCKQPLPAEQVEQAREQALKEFNERKAKRLEEITAEGQATKAAVENVEQTIQKIERSIEKLDKDIETIKARLQRELEKLNEMEMNKKDIEENEEYRKKLEEKERIELEIEQIQTSLEESIKTIENEIATLEQARKDVQDDLNKINIAKEFDERIKELEKTERELAEYYEELEKEIYLTEEFTRVKVTLIEGRIAEKFKYARFKLFEEQINGGLNEICETMYEGVPYSRGLNNAARINVGLDIINTLSEHYGVYVPIFIDNRESVTDLIDVKSQVISLVVDPKAVELEVSETLEKAV